MNPIHLRVEPLEDRLTPVTLPPGFNESLLCAGLTNPTSMTLAPDGRIFVSEQGGTLRVIENGVLLPTPFVSLTVGAGSERGLLGIAFDPNFAANGFVYVYYTVPESGATAPHNRVSRFTASGNVAVAGSEVPILDLDPLSIATNHNGGGLQFGPDGKLYVPVGDNANGNNSQTLSNLLGKVLRINPNGSIPPDNPFVGVPGARGEIWALGLRNPFNIAFQPGTGRLSINDVGQSTFEEIDEGHRGANYGWPTTEGDFDPAAFPQFTRPLYSYPHVGTQPFAGVAITGGVFYNPTTPDFPPAFVGDYFFCDFAARWINIYDPRTGAVTNFATFPTGQLMVDMDLGSRGELLYLARNFAAGEGAIFQISFANLSGTLAVGAGAGGGPVAKLIDLASGAPKLSVSAFAPGFAGGVRVAAADVTGDTVPDLVTGAGPGGGPDVRVFDGASGKQVRQVFPFESTFTGGVFVTAADVNGDGSADLILSPDVGGGARVRVLSGKDLSVLADFFAFADDTNFRGGARVAAGDINGDGTPDLVVAAGAGGGPRVAVFNGKSLRPGVTPARLLNDFFAFEPGLRNGAFVAVGDANGDGRADVIAGAGPGGAPRVVVFSGSQLPSGGPGGSQIASFFAGDPAGRGGVPVAARNVDADDAAEVLVGSVAGSPPRVSVFKVVGGSGSKLTDISAFEDTFTGGVFVG